MYIKLLERTKGSLTILLYLARNGKTDILTIAKSSNIPRNTCYVALRRLENMGLITSFKMRSRPPKVYCRLTQRGVRISKNLLKTNAMLRDTLEGLNIQLLELNQKGKPDEITDRKRLKILSKMVKESISCGKLDEAMIQAKEIGSLSKRLHENQALAESLRNIGSIHRRRGEFNAAKKCFQRSVQLAEELKDYKGMASDRYHLGVIFEKRGNYSKALAAYEQSKKYAEKCDCEIEKSRSLLGIGRIFARKGQYEDALKKMKIAVKIFERKKSVEDLPRAYANLGATIFYINLDEAIKWHEKCIKISENEGNLRMLGYGLSNAAGCYIKKMALDKGRKYLERALPIFMSLNEKQMVSSIFAKYARISLLKKRRKSAIKYLGKAMEIAKDIGVPSETADVLVQYGFALKERGEYTKAKSFFKKALKIYSHLGSKKMIEKVKRELEDLRSPQISLRHHQANLVLRE